MGNDDLDLTCGCKHSSVSTFSVTFIYDRHNTCPPTLGGSCSASPHPTHADGLFPSMLDLHLSFQLVTPPVRARIASSCHPGRDGSSAAAMAVRPVLRSQSPCAREPACTHRPQRHPSNSLKSMFVQPFLNILRTAKFWQKTHDSVQSDGWVAAAPHSQLSSRGIWQTRCSCQLVPAIASFPVSTEIPLSLKGKGHNGKDTTLQ